MDSIPTVFADRSDGLGERLNCVFNGLLVAKILNAEFRFKWPDSYVLNDQFHSVEPAVDLFSADFIETHHVLNDESLVSDGIIKCPRGVVEELQAAFTAQLENGVRRVPQASFIFNVSENTERAELHAKVASALRFKPEVCDTLEVARKQSALTGKHVVFHIRAGDIVYGRFKEYPSFVGKAIPLPLAFVIAGKLIAEGQKVKVLGQEGVAIQKMSQRMDLLPPLSHAPPGGSTRLLESFFDIGQIGSAEKIYAGSSGFPRFASQFYLKPMVNPLKQFDPIALMDDVFLEIEKNEDIYSSEQKAYTNFFYYLLLDSSDYTVSCRLLDCALLHQPENVMFQLWSALNELKFLRYQEADKKFTQMWHQADQSNFRAFSRSAFCKMLMRNDGSVAQRCYSKFSVFIKEGASNASSACKALNAFIEKTGPLTEEEWLKVSSFI